MSLNGVECAVDEAGYDGGPVRPRTTAIRGPTVRQQGRQGFDVTERSHLRRRASDRAEERATRAAIRGDIVAMWVAKGQAEAAERRRTEWAELNEATDDTIPARERVRAGA